MSWTGVGRGRILHNGKEIFEWGFDAARTGPVAITEERGSFTPNDITPDQEGGVGHPATWISPDVRTVNLRRVTAAT